jgi:hypothetical protein
MTFFQAFFVGDTSQKYERKESETLRHEQYQQKWLFEDVK